MAAVVEGKEGPRTEFLGDEVPPKNGDKSVPRILIESKSNSTVIFVLQAPEINEKCKVIDL